MNIDCRLNPRRGLYCHSTIRFQQSKIRRLLPTTRLSRKNPPPVSQPWQCTGCLRLPTVPPKPSRSPQRSLPRRKQSIQRGPRTRQRRIFRARAQQRTFGLAQLGILRKDDLLEVVLDPSPVKPEKRIPGPAPSSYDIGRSTGVQLAQPRRQAAAKLIHSIGWPADRQFWI